MCDKSRTRLFTFGSGTLGELGHERHEDTTGRPEATEVDFPCREISVTSVALGNDHSLALAGGKLYRWGLLCRPRPLGVSSPERGDVGTADGGPKEARTGVVVPLPAPMSEWLEPAAAEGHLPEESSVVAIAAGGSNSYILTEIGEVFVLGHLRSLGGDPGQLRHLWGCPRQSLELQVRQIAAGWRHCIILTQAGTVFAIGDDEHGQCAGNSTGQVPVPLPEVSAEGVLGVAAGACHSVAWCPQGLAFTWGHGGAGRLGHGDAESHRTPLLVQAFSELKVVHARCGANFTVFVTMPQRALMFGGAGVRVWSCGGNQYGQLGHSGEEDRAWQVPMPKVIDFHFDMCGSPRGTHGIISVEALECGAHHTLCLTRPPGHDRLVLWAWGSSAFGQCGRAMGGDAAAGGESEFPCPVPLLDFLPPSRHWPVAVAAGRTHSAVLAKSLGTTTRLTQIKVSPPGDVTSRRKPGPPGPSTVPSVRLGRFQGLKDFERRVPNTVGGSEVGQGEVIDDFCAKLCGFEGLDGQGGRSVCRSQSVPSRLNHLPTRSLQGLVALGEEALRRPLGANAGGARPSSGSAPCRRWQSSSLLSRSKVSKTWSSTAACEEQRGAKIDLRGQLGRHRDSSPALLEAPATSWPGRKAERRQPLHPGWHGLHGPRGPRPVRGSSAWWQAFSESDSSEDSPMAVRRSLPLEQKTPELRVSQSEAALSSLREDAKLSPGRQPALPPVMSLSDQRWSSMRQLLRDLDDAVACVVKRRSQPTSQATPSGAETREASRLGRTPGAARSVGAPLVQQDPVACRARQPPSNPNTPTGADARQPSLFRRQSSSFRTGIDAQTQTEDLKDLGTGGERPGERPAEHRPAEEAPPAAKSPTPFQLGGESPTSPGPASPTAHGDTTRDTLETTTVVETTTAMAFAMEKAEASPAVEVKKLEERSCASLCRVAFSGWRQHVEKLRGAPQELRSIMDSLDSGSESLLSVDEEALPLESTAVTAAPTAAVSEQKTGPFPLGDSSDEEKAGPAVRGLVVAKSATGVEGVSSSSSSSSSGHVEHLEVLESAGSDSS